MSARLPPRGTGQAGQATVEWVALCLVVALLFGGLLAVVGSGLPGGVLARALALRLLCAADLSSACAESGDLVAAYGSEVAELVERNAPLIVYEDGMTGLPVDFRSCRGRACGNGPDAGPVWTSDTGEPATAFVHVVDCRTTDARAQSVARGYECDGERAGNLYVQFWLYYEDSTWLGGVAPGGLAHHEDDWEGTQLRIGPDGTDSRATSHHGYNYDGGPTAWPSDAGLLPRAAWGDSTRKLFVSGGSHAGHVHEGRHLSLPRVAKAGAGAGMNAYALANGRRPRAETPRRLTVAPPRSRWTPAPRLVLVPIETLGRRALRTRFAITPPWEKPVYTDPEDQGT
jgi:hypothetical protein